jgi:excisionase family DNA binding protein
MVKKSQQNLAEDIAEIKSDVQLLTLSMIATKKALTLREAARYLNMAESTLYKYTSASVIPFSKPNGKKIYFDRDLLDQWLLGNSSNSREKREIDASTYVTSNPSK